MEFSERPCNACGWHHQVDAFKPGDRVRSLVRRQRVAAGSVGSVREWRNYNAPVWVRVQFEYGDGDPSEHRANYSPCELEHV